MKNNDLEYSVGQEYTPLPDEYLQKTDNATEYKGKGKKAAWKKMMLMTVAFVTIIYATLAQEAWSPAASSDSGSGPQINDIMQETSDNEPQTNDIPTETTDNTKEPTSEKPSEPTGVAELPTLPMYPVEDGTSFVTVYNDSYGLSIGENMILTQSFVFDSTILSGMNVEMPAYEPQDGFVFMGWVVYYDKDYKSGPSIGLMGDALTLYDYCYIKPENGSRDIEVHAAWRHDGIGEWPHYLTLDANGGTIEGESTMTYDANGPMGSGSYVYLCAYPVPVRDGYTFAGWYTEPDCSGKQKTLLQGASFYETETGEDGKTYVDFSKSKPITLYAGWVKN